MQQFLEQIRTHFNIIYKKDFLSLTLINPNLDLGIIREIKQTFRLQHQIKKIEIIIIESDNFTDELLRQLAEALPESLQELSVDFTGCENLKAQGFVCLFERLGAMSLRKLKLDLSEVFDVDDLVMEALSLLLQGLQDLQEFYLDLYEVDQITEDGYFVLGESLTLLTNLKSFYLDLSANPNLTQDCLELIFTNIQTQHLTNFSFRILDIEHIGGGSFFKLGQVLNKMTMLKTLELTISTFSNLNHKGVYAILKQVTYLENLQNLALNLSDTQLPQKILSYLNLPQNVQRFSLDISCNSLLTDGDVLSLIKNIKNLTVLSINLDFCKNVTEDSIEELLQIFFSNKNCQQLYLPDRTYSLQFQESVIKKAKQIQKITKIQLTDIKKEIQQKWTALQNLFSTRINLTLQNQASSENSINPQNYETQ